MHHHHLCRSIWCCSSPAAPFHISLDLFEDQWVQLWLISGEFRGKPAIVAHEHGLLFALGRGGQGDGRLHPVQLLDQFGVFMIDACLHLAKLVRQLLLMQIGTTDESTWGKTGLDLRTCSLWKVAAGSLTVVVIGIANDNTTALHFLALCFVLAKIWLQGDIIVKFIFSLA